jgi:hypothetical protein
MLCERLINPAHLQDCRYIAEPKLDGQRVQLYVIGAVPSPALADVDLIC